MNFYTSSFIDKKFNYKKRNTKMLLLGIDIGTSSIKVSVVDADTQHCIAAAQFPETESEIIALKPGWAEQDPAMWWQHVQQAILKVNALKKYNPQEIAAIGISYQMHGLVCLDKNKNVVRNSIIWCDSRAVEIGNKAFDTIGHAKCLKHLLNSPGNFTASKLAWVKENEPEVFNKIDKIMLPGDYIAMMLTGNITTTISALSEGVFWDFINNELSKDVFNHYGFDAAIIPAINNVFTEHGKLKKEIAIYLSLKEGIPVTYKAGDQPNNALSLNVLEPGEVAATAGTSGVIYGVSDQLTFDPLSRINTFAHVNYKAPSPVIASKAKQAEGRGEARTGVLLCINGTGILYRWMKNMTGNLSSYKQMNDEAAKINIGSDGVMVLPFGNGAERIFENKIPGAHICNLDLNKHSSAHLYRAAQEGIAFAFRYGLDIMKENGMNPQIIRAGKANMFLSEVFTDSFVNTLNTPVQLFNCDGSVGAAIGAGIGAGVFSNYKEAFNNFKAVKIIEPGETVNQYNELYESWKNSLQKHIN